MALEFKDVGLEIKSVEEDGIFEGYGSLFIKEPDSYGDIVQKDSLTRSIMAGGRNKTGIAMLWQHRSDKICGVWLSLQEDKKGLKVRGQLALETQLGKEIYEIMKLGAKTGAFKLSLSIGYDTIDFDIDSKTKIRTLKELSLWELSLCTFPARIGATVDNIKTASSVRGLESRLRDIISKKAAQYVIHLCRDSINEKTFKGDDWSAILSDLKQINSNTHGKFRRIEK